MNRHSPPTIFHQLLTLYSFMRWMMKTLLNPEENGFNRISSVTINPGFSDILTSEPLKYHIRVAARASVQTIFRLYEGSSLRKSIQVQGVNLFNTTGTFAQITDSTGSFADLCQRPRYLK